MWGEKITPDSYLFCPKYGPSCKMRRTAKPLSEQAIRKRIKELAKKAGIDLTNIQPNHRLRKAGNTAANILNWKCVSCKFAVAKKESIEDTSERVRQIAYDKLREQRKGRRRLIVELESFLTSNHSNAA